MIKKYVDQFMVWQLHNRREIVCAVVGFEIMLPFLSTHSNSSPSSASVQATF